MKLHNLREIARSAMQEHGLEPDFSAAALDELSDLQPAKESQADRVHDLRALLWCSIDNDDSRDLDQLTVAKDLPQGTQVLIAIADVDVLLHGAAAIEQRARTNTTSVYTAAGVFPMIPERLSTDLTSLNQGQERFAVVVDFVVAEEGHIVRSDVYRAKVFNHAKLTYDAVAAWLDGNAAAPPRLAATPGLAEQIHLQDRAARVLRERRQAHGALNFETVQTRPVLKEKQLIDLRADEQNRAKDMIEDFMVTANGVVAKFLSAHDRLSLRRCLRSPERWNRIVSVAANYGAQLPAEPNSRALNEFLAVQKVSRADEFPQLSLSIIKLLGSGEYAVSSPSAKTAGHFGLAADDYTHATAPNRRYPDLLTQRMLKATLRGAAEPYSEEELRQLAQHCNEQEKNAAKVERLVRKAASAALLSSRIGERFHGVVTGASSKGTWVRIDQPAIEGKVVRNFEGLDVGDRIAVELLDVRAERGFIDFGKV